MNAPIIAFFSVKRGVGTTSIVYNLAAVYADAQVKVLAVDLDPQASLTGAFANLALRAFPSDLDISHVSDGLLLSPRDLKSAALEEELAAQWQTALMGDKNALATISSLWRAMKTAASQFGVHLVLVDLGPNLTAINRCGLLAADHIILPLSPDVFSAQGLEVVGSSVRKWRTEWRECVKRSPSIELPTGAMAPLGYVVRQSGAALASFEDWTNWIPEYFRKFILDEPSTGGVSISSDPYRLAILRPYPSLLEMAKEARKPMFHLKPADGAIGAHLQAAEDARKDFEALAKAIVMKANLPISLV